MASNDIRISTGKLILTNKTLSFAGTTIALSNIAKFRQYEVPRVYRITNLHLIIAAVVILIFISHMYWGLLFIIPAAWVIYAGIQERRQPKLYGIHLELNSGYRYDFISEDEDGIRNLYSKIREAMNSSDTAMNTTINFNQGKIEFTGDTYNTNNSQVGAIGRNASSNVNFNNSAEDKSSNL